MFQKIKKLRKYFVAFLFLVYVNKGFLYCTQMQRKNNRENNRKNIFYELHFKETLGKWANGQN